MTREPETLIDQMVQALIEGRPVVTPLGREIILRCTRRPEAFGYQSPEEEHEYVGRLCDEQGALLDVEEIARGDG